MNPVNPSSSQSVIGFRASTRSTGLPPKSPNLNAYAERFVRSVKSECLSRLLFFSEKGLRHALKEYIAHYHEERSHQGIGNVIPFPDERNNPGSAQGEIVCRERLGGLLKFYYRKAS